MPVVKLHKCSFCSNAFTQRTALNNHIRDSFNHGDAGRRSYVCGQCFRSFASEGALGDHLRSNVHTRVLGKKAVIVSLQKKSRKFNCLFCNKKFKNPSGVAQHIESGRHRCTRHQVTAAVQAMDIVPKITTKTIEGPSPIPNIITYTATRNTFNGISYSCFLCTRTFRTLSSLTRHLNSAAHDDNEFRCPKCETEFTLVSGFVQHLESRTCGLAKDKQVENYFIDLADRFSGLLKM